QPTEDDKRRFRQRYQINPNKLNIAIVGTSGSGKSTFLNSLRGLSPRDPGAAASGFNETTDRVQGYPDVRNPEITWYDVPGANTPRVSGWRYFVDQGLYVFDVLVVVFADRFTQTAGTLIGNANKCHIPAFLVRTKADQLVNNAIADSGDTMSREEAKEQVVRETRETVQVNLLRSGLPNQRVYIVSRAGMKRLITHQDSSDVVDEQQFLDDIV
ncbi:immunity-related GTPases-like protein, partial [Panaeolus papilionaceus]